MQQKVKGKKLTQLEATAISGNDISSSVLYVAAITIAFAGQYAFIVCIMVVVISYLFRKIYAEVVSALPFNGGTYNVLLNTTSKKIAAMAATLTILSYTTTAVISGNEAIHYLHDMIPSIPIIGTTITLLGFFAILNFLGIKESSKVAIGIFLFHLGVTVVLIGYIILYLWHHDFSNLYQNFHISAPNNRGILYALFFGFSTSMLGISCFESSANFVEEQQKGVFPKTLKNMWGVVSVINPLMVFFALSLFPLILLQSSEYQNTLIAHMGFLVGNQPLAYLISIDAVLVLSGAVLTSYIGVSGLFERMTFDRILPSYFIKKNKWGSHYRIILLFFILCVFILLISNGNINILAGVYSISFLSVMALFGIGNLLLKIYRSGLQSTEKAHWGIVLIGIFGIIIALIGNTLIPPKDGMPSNLFVFLLYFIPSVLYIWLMINRIFVFKILFTMTHFFVKSSSGCVGKFKNMLLGCIKNIENQEFIFFTKNDNIEFLNKAILYIRKNEHTKRIKIVTVLNNEEQTSEKLLNKIHLLTQEYQDMHIEFVSLKENFSPALLKTLSHNWKIPINFMFIASPSKNFPYKIEALGGVRVII